jgi:protoheme IX farnesyltransferase
VNQTGEEGMAAGWSPSGPRREVRPIPGPVRVLFDVVALTKPRLATLVLFTSGVGILVAPGQMPIPEAWSAMLLTALVVASGTTLNMVLERDVDRLMKRTANRPLPAGRLSPGFAVVFGVALAAISLPALAWTVNPLTAALGFGAWAVYLFAYTPLKRRSVAAVYIGAVPGATPILMGWSAATGRLDPPALALFAILFLWQIPHFIAISMFRRDEYAAAGLKILPVEYGDRASLWHLLGTCLGLIVATLLPVYFQIGGPLYTGTAVTLASLSLAGALYGLSPRAGLGWARGYFFGTLVYLPVLLGVLVLDRL